MICKKEHENNRLEKGYKKGKKTVHMFQLVGTQDVPYFAHIHLTEFTHDPPNYARVYDQVTAEGQTPPSLADFSVKNFLLVNKCRFEGGKKNKKKGFKSSIKVLFTVFFKSADI